MATDAVVRRSYCSTATVPMLLRMSRAMLRNPTRPLFSYF